MRRSSLPARRGRGGADGDPARAAQQTIEEFFKWLDSLDRNLTLGDLEIGPEKFEAMANDVIEYDGDGEHYHSVRKLDRDAIVDVLEDCLNPNS